MADYLTLRAALAQGEDCVSPYVEPTAIREVGKQLEDPSPYDALTREELVARLDSALNQLLVADEKLRIISLLADGRDEHGAKLTPAPTPTALRGLIRDAARRWGPRYHRADEPAEPPAVPDEVQPGPEPERRRWRPKGPGWELDASGRYARVHVPSDRPRREPTPEERAAFEAEWADL